MPPPKMVNHLICHICPLTKLHLHIPRGQRRKWSPKWLNSCYAGALDDMSVTGRPVIKDVATMAHHV